ncbi:hypothetical protein TSL6_18020 [Sulfurovum sp. TSL6]|uniref:asparagine synthase-related protein n=1 Tax=Sulfurovum sp. TSL6 TaxID=2826995 RepID=UPI001CC7E87B|nr:asparagine synthase-related protein [Sulfurovum sp. TSL6]GIU01296.1 hypothetical protein TSL6_18020 [Sulfurovum sp. TSL6]
MAGLYGVISTKKQDIKEIYTNFFSSTLDNTINEEFKYKNFIYGRSVIDKFLNDRVLYEDETIIIGFEGVFYNKVTKKSYETIIQWYHNDGIDFVQNIRGQFCGFIYDKNIDKLYIFNDSLSTKPLYIYKNNDVFMFASELKVITKLLSQLSIEKIWDHDAVYSMLTVGHMLNDLTYEKNTKKLNYATIFEIDKHFNMEERQYFNFCKKENFDLSKEQIIEKIDELLISSVKECWAKDDEYNYKHYTFLSGGLDSRVNLFLAKEQGYMDVLTMTFSQSGSSDEKIAQEIASKEGFKHFFYALDNGKFLEKEIERYIEANDGLTIFNGAAAGYDYLSSINHTDFGALHTGQIGDLLFGSYVKKYFTVDNSAISDQTQLVQEITFFEDYAIKYKNNSELFGYEQRVINGTLNGDRTATHFTDMLSPFYNRSLMEFCLTIPDVFKKDEAIYLDWFNNKHKQISNYKWDSAGVKPKSIILVKYAKQFKRYKNAFLRRVGLKVDNMNPFDMWLRNNKKILKNLDVLYFTHINDIEDINLQKLLKNMYNCDIKHNHYGSNNKFLVITVLLSYKLHMKG